MSTRQVGELLDGLVGVSMSAAKVSQLTKQLDAEVSRFHRSPLEDRYRYLFLDAIWLKSRDVAEDVPERARSAPAGRSGGLWRDAAGASRN